MDLYQDAIEGLRSQRGRLESDLALWTERTAPDGELPLHHSQVRRLETCISAALAATIEGTPLEPGAASPYAGTVADLPTLRRCVGTTHLLWDFFRDKLAQRDTLAYCTHLGVADDLAWACYEPFLAAATEAKTIEPHELKEPPLVFFTTDRTPFAQARTKALHPPGLDAKDLEHVIDELHRLPVPVIGMPWAVANCLADVVLVGHEAGHVVAEDLGLAKAAKDVLAGVKLDGDDEQGTRRGVWTAWCDELFADVVGVLATGTAFVSGLAGELAGDPAEVEQVPIDPARPGRYPTPTLRMAVCNDVLGRLDVTPPGAWANAYPAIAGDSAAFAGDVPRVVAELFDNAWEPIGGKRLVDVIPWSAEWETKAATVAGEILAKLPPSVGFDVRIWVAAAMLAALDDPQRFEANGLDDKVASYIIERRSDAVRSADPLRTSLLADPGVMTGAERVDALRTVDQALGRGLGERLRSG